MKDIARAAKEYAHAAHAGQYDADNRLHIAHCIEVAEIIECVSQDEELIAAAYLHDILEDTGTNFTQIEIMFGRRVADLVYEVTEVDGESPNLHSREGMMLKYADRLHNLSQQLLGSDQ